MLRFTLVLLFLAIAIPASGQTAAILPGSGTSCDSLTAGAALPHATEVAADPTRLADASRQAVESAPNKGCDSFTNADTDVAGSSAAGKMLFLKKICWLPFRRATYS